MLAESIVLAIAILVCVWTITPLLRHEAWWIRVFEFPRVQLIVVAACGLIVGIWAFGFSSYAGILVAALFVACICFHLFYVWPYTRVHGTQVKHATNPTAADCVSILVSNVLMTNRRSQDLLALIHDRDPDLVLAVETDQWWETELDALQATYPYAAKQPLDNLYGMHLYSKLELIDPRILFLLDDGVPSIHAEVALRSGRRIELHCLHPAPPSPTENATSLERDAELLVVAKSFDATKQSVIVAGDLNDVAWSATTRLFQKTSQLLDPRIGRGMFNTFHAKLPFLRWPLDHIFHSADFKLVSIERLPAVGSDHFPIFAALCRVPTAPAEHEHPRASTDDAEWAQEKINKVHIDGAALKQLDQT